MPDEPNTASSSDPLHEEQFGSARLPPKPDPETGQPAPPHAPRYTRDDKGRAELDANRDTTQSGRFRPPPGQGPSLAWYRPSRRKGIRAVVGTYILVVVLLFVVRGFTTDWFQIWWIWLVIALGAAPAYPIAMTENCAAGAEWVMVNKSWIRTYELTSIKAYTYSNSLNLHFTDVGGRKLQADIRRLQDDRRIWDLVYNGILHSVVKSGADTNQLARGTLNLPSC